MELQYILVSEGVALYFPSPLPKPLQRRYNVYITIRDINPGYFRGALCCMAPLGGRRLVLQTP